MWKNQSIELATQKALKDQLGPELGEELYARYLTARKALVEDVLPYIVARQPNLTDHSENHVADVFKNIESLLGKSLKSCKCSRGGTPT